MRTKKLKIQKHIMIDSKLDEQIRAYASAKGMFSQGEALRVIIKEGLVHAK